MPKKTPPQPDLEAFNWFILVQYGSVMAHDLQVLQLQAAMCLDALSYPLCTEDGADKGEAQKDDAHLGQRSVRLGDRHQEPSWKAEVSNSRWKWDLCHCQRPSQPNNLIMTCQPDPGRRPFNSYYVVQNMFSGVKGTPTRRKILYGFRNIDQTQFATGCTVQSGVCESGVTLEVPWWKCYKMSQQHPLSVVRNLKHRSLAITCWIFWCWDPCDLTGALAKALVPTSSLRSTRQAILLGPSERWLGRE